MRRGLGFDGWGDRGPARLVLGKVRQRPVLGPRYAAAVLGLGFDRPPIIIGGCGRSGTSLLVSLLLAHPHVLAIPYETEAFTPTLYSDDPDPGAPFEMWRLYMGIAEAGRRRSSRRWCEKTPKNVLSFGRILSRFGPDVRLIHLVRDGRDVVTSIHVLDPHHYWVPPTRWVAEVRAGLEWSGHPSVYTLRYEDLVRDMEGTVAALGDFLGEDCRSLASRWPRHARVKRFGPQRREVGRPLEGKGIGRWKAPEHRARVESLLGIGEARELLGRLGYLDAATTRRADVPA